MSTDNNYGIGFTPALVSFNKKQVKDINSLLPDFCNPNTDITPTYQYGMSEYQPSATENDIIDSFLPKVKLKIKDLPEAMQKDIMECLTKNQDLLDIGVDAFEEIFQNLDNLTKAE